MSPLGTSRGFSRQTSKHALNHRTFLPTVVIQQSREDRKSRFQSSLHGEYAFGRFKKTTDQKYLNIFRNIDGKSFIIDTLLFLMFIHLYPCTCVIETSNKMNKYIYIGKINILIRSISISSQYL